MSQLLKSLMESPLEGLAPVTEVYEQLSPEAFKSLNSQIDVLRAKIDNKEEISVEETRLIVVWFRERRGKAYTFQKAKVSATSRRKPAGEKKTPVKKAKPNTAKNMDILSFMDLAGL